MSKSKPLSYEDALEKLEAIIEKIEQGEVGLEETLASAREGMELIRHCRGILDSARKRVDELMVEPDDVEAGEDEDAFEDDDALEDDPDAEDDLDDDDDVPSPRPARSQDTASGQSRNAPRSRSKAPDQELTDDELPF